MRYKSLLAFLLLIAAPVIAQTARIVAVESPRVIVEVQWTQDPITPQTAFAFAVYRARLDPQPVWSAVQTIAPGRDGWFRVVLGLGSEDTLPASLLADLGTIWLEVEGPRSTIRIPLTFTPKKHRR